MKALGDVDQDDIDDGLTLFEEFEANYGYNFANIEAGDCDDQNRDANPGNTAEDDVPYDGLDADCGANNDFDVDGDGYYPAGYADAFGIYKDNYPNTVPWYNDQPGDCFDSCYVADQAPAGNPLISSPLWLAHIIATCSDEKPNRRGRPRRLLSD